MPRLISASKEIQLEHANAYVSHRHPTLATTQARRWLKDKQRKDDSGGFTWRGFIDLFQWTETMACGDRLMSRMTADAEQAKEHFLEELKAARKEHDWRRSVQNWWANGPTWLERTGVKRDKECGHGEQHGVYQ